MAAASHSYHGYQIYFKNCSTWLLWLSRVTGGYYDFHFTLYFVYQGEPTDIYWIYNNKLDC